MECGTTIKKLLFIDKGRTWEELGRILDDEYDILTTEDVEAAKDVLKQNEAEILALLIHANQQEDVREAIEFVKGGNRLISIPILIYADREEPADRFDRLGDGVVDCIAGPYVSRVVKNRIANAIAIADSMTFHGIEEILKQLPSNIYLKDNNGRYIFATKYWHHLNKPDDPNWTIRGKTDPEVRKDKQNAIEAHKRDLEIVKTGRGMTYTIEINEDGIQEFFQIIKQPLFNEEGAVTGIIGLINNVTEYELLKKRLREQAVTDKMTGLYNRMYLEEFLRTYKDDCYPLAMISADCDGLKEINDTYGHTAGDDYIKAAVTLLRNVLPQECILFRMGGDEFLALLPSTSEEAALRLVGQLKEQERSFLIHHKQLSISFGVSAMNSRADDFHVCIGNSDRNMYLEKRRKRGQE